MSNNLGIFLNNTDSDMKFEINLNNFNNLKKNFSSIIIQDLNNDFSGKLKKCVSGNNILKYTQTNDIIKDDSFDINYNKIKDVLDNLNYNNFQYITFISDNYIYTNSLQEYFEYVNKHNLEFYSYTDSTENIYHYQLYIISINNKSMIKFINFINNNENLLNIDEIFNMKMPYLKVAYIPNNIEKNIFYNEEIYENLLDIDLLPIININKLLKIKNNYKYIIHSTIPDNFDINIYKLNEDLAEYNDDKLYNHFLNFGQFEFRKYTSTEYILPIYIRKKLIKNNLLHYFDIPEDFDIFKYRDKNIDLGDLTKKEYIIHWINYGRYEKREYM